ncbi:hypothetical protein DIDNDMLP_00147 [Klebsiella phage KP13-7]|uniref:hypothetical protein n=1 Tax=Klebsiella phage K64-1 TaxID=1439894 RepID=UPI00248AC5A7|nr:hypothetical protein ACQ27_gp301 [Klebsiella phage K64-1]UYL05132.1 hypothetical protein DIDNDMLP_00147 [Klebsiella phage KP13-7]
MKDILIAVDGSAKTISKGMRLSVAKTLSNVCPDSKILFCQITDKNIIELDIDLFFKYDHLLCGTKANIDLIYLIDDFDHKFLITDNSNIESSENLNVVLY